MRKFWSLNWENCHVQGEFASHFEAGENLNGRKLYMCDNFYIHNLCLEHVKE